VRIRAGAWNTGWHNGVGFTQWTGSQLQKDTLKRIAETSQAFHQAESQIGGSRGETPEQRSLLAEAQWHLLRAETSCNLFWGEAWISRSHQDLDAAWNFLNQIPRSIPG